MTTVLRRTERGLGGTAGWALVLVVGLCACTQRMVWTKEGLTAGELHRDQKACNQESGDYGFLNLSGSTPGVSTGGGTASSRQQGDIYQGCMTNRGYSLVPFNPKAPPPGQ